MTREPTRRPTVGVAGRRPETGILRYPLPEASLFGLAAGLAEPARDPPPVPWAAEPRPISRAEAIAALAGAPLAQVERELIEATIHLCGGSIPEAAKVLGVSASTLYRKRAAWTAGRSGG